MLQLILSFIVMCLGTIFSLLGIDYGKKNLGYIGIILLELSAVIVSIYYYIKN